MINRKKLRIASIIFTDFLPAFNTQPKCKLKNKRNSKYNCKRGTIIVVKTTVSVARDVFASRSMFDYRVMGTSRPFVIQIAGQHSRISDLFYHVPASLPELSLSGCIHPVRFVIAGNERDSRFVRIAKCMYLRVMRVYAYMYVCI